MGRFEGFVGPSYVLNSVNVDAQRCVNLYPELIESGKGKGGQKHYLRATPGLRKILTAGQGPIRCIHVDNVGRIFVVSGNELFKIDKSTRWRIGPVSYQATNIDQSTGINTTTNVLTATSHGFYTGLKVQVESDNALPTGLSGTTDYWVIVDSDSTFRLAGSLSNALAGTEEDISAAGSGTLTVTPQIPGVVGDIVVTDSGSTFTKSGHAFYTGLKVQIFTLQSASGGLDSHTHYFVIELSPNVFQLAISISDAASGAAIDLTDVSGEWVITNISEEEGKNLSTSTGFVKAASMSFLGDGRDSSTVFVDGVDNYLYLQNTPTPSDNPGDFNFGSLDAFGYGDVKTATDIVWADGSFIVNEGGTNRFFVSDLQTFHINALSFSSSEGNPDIVLALVINHRDLWVFNEKTIEVYYNTGNADFPYERVGGGFLEIGLAAKRSVAKLDGTLFWLGNSEFGNGVVYAASGLAPRRISTHAVEQAIQKYADISSATAFAYQKDGHGFYVLNFDEATWVYDIATGLWHERAFTSGGDLERHRAEHHAFSKEYGAHIVGDYENGNIYILDENYYFDDETEITRLRTFPHVSADNLSRLFCSRLQIDMETGVGLISGPGSDPQVMLDWSDDGGHTWSDESWTSAGGQVGGIGEYKTRVIWRRLGSFRDRVFRMKITDPVPVTLIDAFIDLEMAAS